MSEPPDSEPCGPAVEVNGIRQDCGAGVWDNAFVNAETRLYRKDCDVEEAFAHGADWAACWITGLMGMAEAIRSRYCSECGAGENDGWYGHYSICSQWDVDRICATPDRRKE